MCVERLAFEVDDRTARRRGQRVGEGLGLQPQLVHIVVERRGRHRKAHAAQFGNHPFTAFKGLRAQAPAHFRGFIHHGLEAQLHQLVGRHHPGHAGADNRHFSAKFVCGNTAQASGVFDPVIEGKREVRAEDGDGFFTVDRVAIILVHG